MKSKRTDTIEKNKNKESENNEHSSMNIIYRFFCWCSGARMYILKKCPTDYNTFFGIGIVIFLTGIMASISGAYAFYTAFKSIYLAISFGAFWGILIFFLDWYLVSSLKKQNRIWQELKMSVPRIILAILIAVVISKPIELKLFEKEINNQITIDQLNGGLANKNLIDEEFNEIVSLKKANEDMALQLKYKETERNKLFELVIKEAEGQSATAKIGKGPVYKEKKIAYDKSEVELSELKSTFIPLITQNNIRINNLQQKRDNKLDESSQTVKNTDGFLARITAMNAIVQKDKSIAIINWFILILFICIESAPLIVKLLSTRGVYDEILDLETYQQKLEAKRQLINLKYEDSKNHKALEEKNKEELDAVLQLNHQFLFHASTAQAEINELIVNKWKDQEIKKIENNLKDYIPKIEQIIGIHKFQPVVETQNHSFKKDGSDEEKLVN